jgi:Tfp pilus assembly protein PilF
LYEYPSLQLRQIEDSVTARLASLVGTPVRSLVGDPMYASPAYDDLARGDYFLRRPGLDAADSARAAYARALSQDPNLAIVKIRLARALAVVESRSGRTKTASANVGRGMALVDSVLASDPKASEAWTVRAMLLRLRDPDHFDGTLAAHKKAVSSDPADADAYHEFGETLLLLGNENEAAARFRRALELEPNRAETLRSLAELERFARRFTTSCAYVNASIAADPYDPLSYALRSQVRLRLDEFRDAYADAEIAARLSGERWGDALMVLVLAGARDIERAKRETRQLARSRMRQPSDVLAVREARYMAGALALIGDRDTAVDALSRARPRGAEFRTALRDPGLDLLRGEARFRAMEHSSSTGGAVGAPTS